VSVGKNEKWLKDNQVNYEKVYVHATHHANYYPNAQMIDLKLLFDAKTGQILGAQAVGKQGVDKRIDVLAVAQRAGMTVQDLEHLELSYAPPFGSAKDIINQAGFIATNLLKNDAKAIHFDEIDHLQDNQLLLDVRTLEERKQCGYIKNSINIPLNELRNRIHELPIDKEIVIYCQVGLRGYVAYRQLVNNGYSALNLIGGYRTYLFARQ